MAQLRTDVASLSIDLAGPHRRAQPRQRHQPPARRQLHRPGREQLEPMADRIEVVGAGAARDRRGRGPPDEVEDELFRFARIVEGNDDLRMALVEPGSAGRPARRDRRRPAREPVAADDARDRGVHRRRRSWSRPARDRRRGSSSSRRRAASTRWPRSVRAVPLDDAQVRAARHGAVAGDKQDIEVRVVVDRPSSAGSSPRSATR